jgi:hypothetical protein
MIKGAAVDGNRARSEDGGREGAARLAVIAPQPPSPQLTDITSGSRGDRVGPAHNLPLALQKISKEFSPEARRGTHDRGRLLPPQTAARRRDQCDGGTSS